MQCADILSVQLLAFFSDLFETLMFCSWSEDVLVVHVVCIGVAPITQYMHVRNKKVTLKGAHLMW